MNPTPFKSVDEFIDLLATALESHGIDATNWDGDDAAHIIVANGIKAAIDEKLAAVMKENISLRLAIDDGTLALHDKLETARKEIVGLKLINDRLEQSLEEAIEALREFGYKHTADLLAGGLKKGGDDR